MAQGVSSAIAQPVSMLAAPVEAAVVTKTKRKVTKYQRQFGKELKRLKAKHSKTPVTRLMKRAHAATKKAMK